MDYRIDFGNLLTPYPSANPTGAIAAAAGTGLGLGHLNEGKREFNVNKAQQDYQFGRTQGLADRQQWSREYSDTLDRQEREEAIKQKAFEAFSEHYAHDPEKASQVWGPILDHLGIDFHPPEQQETDLLKRDTEIRGGTPTDEATPDTPGAPQASPSASTPDTPQPTSQTTGAKAPGAENLAYRDDMPVDQKIAELKRMRGLTPEQMLREPGVDDGILRPGERPHMETLPMRWGAGGMPAELRPGGDAAPFLNRGLRPGEDAMSYIARNPPKQPAAGDMGGEAHLDESIAPKVAGNVRPLAPGEYVRNPDQSWSSEVTMTVVNPDLNGGRATVIPSMWIKDGKPYIAKTEDEAVELARQSGLSFRSYGSLQEAEKASVDREVGWQKLQRPEDARSVAPLYEQGGGDRTMSEGPPYQTRLGTDVLNAIRPRKPGGYEALKARGGDTTEARVAKLPEPQPDESVQPPEEIAAGMKGPMTPQEWEAQGRPQPVVTPPAPVNPSAGPVLMDRKTGRVFAHMPPGNPHDVEQKRMAQAADGLIRDIATLDPQIMPFAKELKAQVLAGNIRDFQSFRDEEWKILGLIQGQQRIDAARAHAGGGGRTPVLDFMNGATTAEEPTKQPEIADQIKVWPVLGSAEQLLESGKGGTMDVAAVRSVAKLMNSGVLTDRDADAPLSYGSIVQKITRALDIGTSAQLDPEEKAALLAFVKLKKAQVEHGIEGAYRETLSAARDMPPSADFAKGFVHRTRTRYGAYPFYKQSDVDSAVGGHVGGTKSLSGGAHTSVKDGPPL